LLDLSRAMDVSIDRFADPGWHDLCFNGARQLMTAAVITATLGSVTIALHAALSFPHGCPLGGRFLFLRIGTELADV
jgi:hypothetical protein